jgi:molybdopterin-guanine dinucleotide biosynthesis protein A
MKPEAQSSVEICILAGGLSRRMGSDKSRLKLGGHTMLGHIRTTAKTLRLPVRVIRRDAVARCGPLGGIYTALKTTKADAVLFLACDMPFVTETLMRAVLRRFGRHGSALFVCSDKKPGFPFVIGREALPTVRRQIDQGKFSLGELSSELRSKLFNPPARQRAQLRNINTLAEWVRALKLFERGTEAVPGAKREN